MLTPQKVSDFRYQLTRLAKRLRQISQNDPQSWSHMLIISAIDRMGDGVTPSELAMAENIYSSNLAAILRQLEDEGMIQRVPDAVDRRKIRVHLTEKGKAELECSRKRRDEWLAQAITHTLSEAEAEELFKAASLLERIADNG